MGADALLVAAGALEGAPAAQQGKSVGKGSGGLLVFARHMNKTLPVDLDPDATVEDFLAEVAKATGDAEGVLAARFGGAIVQGKTALADAGICPESLVDVEAATASAAWGSFTEEEWEVRGQSVRRVRTTGGWQGAVAVGAVEYTEGRHLFALVPHIDKPGSTNFSVGLTTTGVNLRNQMYPQQQCWTVIDHGDAYAGGRSHSPRTGFKSKVPIVFALDMNAKKCALYVYDSKPVRVVAFEHLQGPVSWACGTLACSEAGGFGADIVMVPDWARSTEFLDDTLHWGSKSHTEFCPPAQSWDE